MSSTPVFAAVEQPDCAVLEEGGVTFRCYVYRRPRLKRIEATIFVEQEDGQCVQVWTGTVRTAPVGAYGQDGFPDCPRVLSRRNQFICHWLEEGDEIGDPVETTGQIGRATFDVTDIGSGWTFVGLQDNVDESRLYDHCVIDGDVDDFIVVWREADDPTNVTVGRYEPPYDWSDFAWLSSQTLTSIDNRVLAVAADADTNDVMIAWQRTVSGDGELWCGRFNTSNGVGFSSDVVSADLDDGDSQFCNAGFARLESLDDDWALVYEFRPTSTFDSDTHPFQRGVGWCQVNGSTAQREDNTHWAWNYHLVSRPWTWAAGYATGLNVYCMLTFKSQRLFSEWDQNYGYIVDLDRLQWDETAGTVRPKVKSVLSAGTVDGRPTGHVPNFVDGSPSSNEQNGATKRMNHLSHASGPPQYTLGPDRKAVVIATIAWQRLFAREPGFDLLDNPNRPPAILVPSVAAVRGVRFYHEDPWVLARDSKEPPAHTTKNYKGAHHRPIATSTEIAGALVFAGGVTQTFDGANLVELGFPHNYEIVAGAAAAGGDNDYYYCVTAVWNDREGQMHRGPPEGPVVIGTQDPFASGNGTSVDLTIRQICMSMKDNRLHYPNASPINLEVWRTYIPTGGSGLAAEAHTVNGQTYTSYLFRRCWTIGSSNQPLEDTPVNDPTAWAQIITDEALDDDIEEAELLPWQLNTQSLQWVPALHVPHMPLSICTTWQNRLFGVNPEDPRVIVYSNEILPYGTQYVMPEFIDDGNFRFDGLGEITAMQGMDEGLIIFTRDGIYALAGDGADALGLDAQLDLRVISQSTGCIEPKSVVLGPPGVFFQSAKGYYLVTRSLELDYASAGKAIEDLIRAGGNVRAATLLEDRHQIRLSLNAAPLDTSPATIQPITVIHDYDHRQWATAYHTRLFNPTTTNPRLSEMQGATWWRGIQGETLHVILEQGGLAVERASDDTVFSDDDWTTAVPIPIDVTVDWLHLAGISGYQRINSIGIQTEKVNDVELTVELWYDFTGDYDDSGAAHSTWTDNAERGYVRVRPTYRKCSAILIRVYESGDGEEGPVPLTENLKITSIVLEVETIPGPRRVADNQVAGAG